MSVFGPKYPPELQAAINHAERFCELLARLEKRRPELARAGRRWLVRRREEIETVLDLIVQDLVSDCVDLSEATRSAASYLAELHVGAQRALGLGALLECCIEDEALTLSVASCREAVTLDAVTTIALGRARAGAAGETWFDPSALLDTREAPPAVAISVRGESSPSETAPPPAARQPAGMEWPEPRARAGAAKG